MNVAMLLEMAAGSFGEREAVRCGELAFDFAGLERAVREAAGAIVASGCRHAALLDETSPAVPIGLFAAAWAGVPFVPLSYRLTDAELDALLERIAPAHLVTGASRASALATRAALHSVPSDAWLAPATAPAAEPGAWPDDADAPAVLLFTSGTTGTPKAAVLRHRHLVSYILGSVEFGAAGEDEATLVSVPPYHIAALAAVLSSVYAGRRIVQLPRFDARAWIALAARERVTHAFLVPTMLARIADALAQEPVALPALRAIAYGGGKMPLAVIERAMTLLPGVDFTNAYGLTETSSTVALLGPDDHRAAQAAADPLLRRRLASVGRALPGVEIEIRDAEGKPVAPGARGEVHVRGEQVAGEYLGRGSQLGRDGWFATRDAGFLDADGFLFLEGRLDDVIVRGGENLSPGEIEDALRDHAAVADCAVVGVPDEQWGEAVAAAIVLREGERASADELRAWVRERLRSSRVPERIEFRDALPYTDTGKLLRRRVRADSAGETPAVSAPLALRDAIAQLRAPDAAERFSPVAGEPLLAVRLAGDACDDAIAAAALAGGALAIAVEDAAAPAARRWAERFDAIAADAADLARLESAIRATPLAAATLAQLLRGGAARSIEDGLVAESLAYAALQAGPEHRAWLAARERRVAAPDATPPLRLQREGAQLRVTLARPARRNAYSVALRDALVEALALAVADDSIARVVLDAEGPAFCAGGDLDEFGSAPDPATAHAVRCARSAARLVARLAPRALVRVHGACVGAGVELAAFAGRVEARADAWFQLPELAMGLLPGAGGTVSLPRRIGRQRTAWLALTGARLDAETALAWGLVDAVR